MKELTMVDLSVYTNHRMGDMYYNRTCTETEQRARSNVIIHSIGIIWIILRLA